MKDPIIESKELVHETTESIQKLGPVTVGFFVLLIAIMFVGWSFLTKAETNLVATLAAAEENTEKLTALDDKLSKSILRMQESSERLLNAMVQTCVNTAKNETQRTACLQLPPTRL